MSTIVSPSTGSQVDVSYGQAVAAHLNALTVALQVNPASTPTSTTAGTQTWVTIGSVTVPSWAAGAVISWAVNGFIENGASGSTKIAVAIGSVVGTFQRILATGAVSTTRWTCAFNDSLSGLSTGVQSLAIKSQFTSGGTYTADTLTTVSASVLWTP